MKDYIKSSITINIEMDDNELLSKIDNICNELSLSLDQFILSAINKMIYDVEFVHKLRKINKKEI